MDVVSTTLIKDWRDLVKDCNILVDLDSNTRSQLDHHPKFKIKFSIFFTKYYIFFIYEALIHSIWTTDEKVKGNLVFQAI